MKCNTNDPNWCIQLPRLSLLKSQDLPSFILNSSSKDGKYSFALPLFKEQLDTLDGEENLKVLVNTFDALELDALKAIEKYNLIGIGPLIPLSFLDEKDPLDSFFGFDLFQKSNDGYMEWDAKLIEDVWKTGVRFRVNEDSVFDSEEIKRCIEIIMDGGEKGEEMRKNAQNWKKLAREAVKEGGSSEINLKAFVQQVGQDSKAKHDGVMNVINALTNSVKKMTSKRGVISSKRISYPYTPLEIKVAKRRRKDISKASSSIENAKLLCLCLCLAPLFNVQGSQESRIRNCGLFIATYAKYLGDGLQVPNDGLDVGLLRKRYAALLWKYGEAKAQKPYKSDIKDPRRPKPNSIAPNEE
ncbi:Crocetin glucosyltransferase, chloroplastic [Capsicum baccatum]|uniref:Crocetin glucosyltransferase, chloroplastic n=1 Tax=Capsicum baccatum TaxID=33114 RepID=A0A2G2X362_CAPBA|nr:Crocetin glucosyltransferase, chloroplastic [Capsicum baccatum]